MDRFSSTTNKHTQQLSFDRLCLVTNSQPASRQPTADSPTNTLSRKQAGIKHSATYLDTWSPQLAKQLKPQPVKKAMHAEDVGMERTVFRTSNERRRERTASTKYVALPPVVEHFARV